MSIVNDWAKRSRMKVELGQVNECSVPRQIGMHETFFGSYLVTFLVLGAFCNFKPKPRSEPDSGTDDGIDRGSGQCLQCGSATSYGRHYSYGEYYNYISTLCNTLLSITETLTSGYQTCTTAVHNLSVISSSCL